MELPSNLQPMLMSAAGGAIARCELYVPETGPIARLHAVVGRVHIDAGYLPYKGLWEMPH